MKVLLDCDVGTDIDDAWAIAFAARYSGFELLGVTITDANTPARARVACKLLHALGRRDVPVAVGRTTPTPEGRIDYQFSWAEDFNETRPIARPAADFIVDTLRTHRGEVTLIAVGPLQNLGDALARDPAIVRYVRRVVLMSGNIYNSAWSPRPVAEWNVKAAIPEARRVYGAGFPLTTVPADTTSHVQLADAERARVRDTRSAVGQSLESLYRLWIDAPSTRMTLHDQMALAEAARPGAFFRRVRTLPIAVDEQGFTRIDRARGRPVNVCFDVRRDALVGFYLDVLTGAAPPAATARAH